MERKFRISYMHLDNEEVVTDDIEAVCSSAKEAYLFAWEVAPKDAKVFDLSDDGPNGLLGTSFRQEVSLDSSAQRKWMDCNELEEREAEAIANA